MAVLQMLKGTDPGHVYPLTLDKSILGRHPDCDVVLEVGAVSRQHAQIIQSNGQYFVEDLNSRNGTYVNGSMIEGSTQLKDNDRLKICDMLFTFHFQTPVAKVGNGSATGVMPGEIVPADEPSSFEEDPRLQVTEDSGEPTATVMSTISVQESASLRVSVRPEVKLKALIDITQNLAQTLKLEEILPKILVSMFKVFPQADRGFILLKEEGRLIPKAVHHRRESTQEQVRVSRTIINQVLQRREAILSADAVNDSRFDMAQSITEFRIHSMMCVPLFTSEEEGLGVIQLDTQDQMQKFEQEDLDVLIAIASQASFIIENTQLHETLEIKRKEQQQMEFARRVQQGFLPTNPPDIKGYQFFDYYQAAREVGGDYFDYIPLPNNRLAVALGDVAGKGVAAALLMAKLSSEVRYCLVSQPTPAAAIDQLNAAFCRSSWDDRFVTFVLLVLDLNTHEVTVVNAGHMPPLLRRTNGEIIEIDQETELPLGVTDEIRYGQYTMPLAAGESLTLFTDGFSEAMNSQRDLYGLQRLIKQLKASELEVSSLGKSVLADVNDFIGKQPQSDDMCLVCVGRNPE